jgi:hypothetical protein
MLSPGMLQLGAGSQQHDSQRQAERLTDKAKRLQTENEASTDGEGGH